MFSVEAVLHPYLTTGQKEALGYPADEIKRSWSEIRKPEHSCVSSGTLVRLSNRSCHNRRGAHPAQTDVDERLHPLIGWQLRIVSQPRLSYGAIT